MDQATSPEIRRLAAKTSEKLELFLASLSDADRLLFSDTMARLGESEQAPRALQPGQHVPEFELYDQRGNLVSLQAYLVDGPVVLSFIRGGWCSFCNLELQALQQHCDQIRQAGGQILAITPEDQATAAELAEHLELSFPLLSDTGGQVARACGVTFQLHREILDIYMGWGAPPIDFGELDTVEVPVPATFVLRADGTIGQAFVEVDYTLRMEPVDIVAALRDL